MFLFRFILILILVYLIINFVGKLLFASLANKVRNNTNYRSDEYRRKPEGEVTIQGKKPGSNKKIDGDEGEYVQYEEVKDKSDN